MARFPKLVDSAILRTAAAPNESHMMRVECKGAPSNMPYRVYGKRDQRYLLHYRPESHAHVLDVPVSVWMENGESIARDLLGTAINPRFIVLCLPWESKVAVPEVEEPEDFIDDSDDYRTPEQKALQALEDSETEPPDP